jgi:uncharacterized protein DUF4440
MKSRLIVASALTALVLALAPGASAAVRGDASADTQKGTELVEKFFTIIKDQDLEALERFLSPAFQIQRADGSYLTKDEYLENPAKVESFELSEFQVTREGKTIIVRYDSVADVTIDGVQQSTDPAPRLSVFVKGKKGWRIVAHANFNVPAEAPQG